jgi:hypothetical protein
MSNLILLGSIFVPAVLMLGGLMVWRAVRSLDRRRSPLTVGLLNLPGEGLRKRISNHEEKFQEAATMVVATGPIVLGAWLLARLEKSEFDWSALQLGSGDLLFVAILLILLGGSFWRLIHHANRRRLAVDGLNAELSVAQCLTPLIAEGAMVFHDFPADRGNIDHVVVANAVVFAIETKSRRKPASKGKASAMVRYDGQQLFFPTHTETQPIEQAAYQADWLQKFLRNAGVEGVRVVPLLALPGWYVERINRDVRANVLASNCTNSRFMMSDRFGPPMPHSMRKHIAHVLSDRYPVPKL